MLLKNFCNASGIVIFAAIMLAHRSFSEGGQFPPSPRLRRMQRGVAQLVAYYVRDVGAGSSSLLTPTNAKACPRHWAGRAFLFSLSVDSLLS
jgi:hypothetical protein